ncbi:single-stranded-DNA-specific exonuclease RecJ [Hydrogenivirga caldilitoris]|nr:single-stranded-DNA-specific exonuclease RecJ [Hydrogenivirga caldilitoris]
MRGVSGKEWYVLSYSLKPPAQLIETYGEFLAQLIVNRGYEDSHRELFDLKLKHLLPYNLLPNVEEGVERILRAVKSGERIVLFGDYDVDGITGTAILYQVLKNAGARVVPVLPNRGTGYGLNGELISIFSKYGDLLITIDNGTSAVDEIDRTGIDVVVIDHHNVPERKPEKAILINPKASEGVPKEMKELSSSAICFYMGAVLAKRLGVDMDVRLLLDLVALGTVGDVMPMNRTNRILVSKGLSVLESVANGSLDKPGIKALLSISRIGEKVSAKDIAYSIAPRINAPGRVSNPKLALELLIEENPKRAELLARKIERVNLKRRAITDRVYKEAYQKAIELSNKNFISLWSRGWHVGVLGIVAGRLSNLLGKPVAVFSKGKNHAVGSVRSIEGIDVYEGLSRLSHMFVKWGGHMQAAGLTLESRLLETFSRDVDELFSHVPRELPPLYIDTELPISQITAQILKSIERLEPYGEKNPIPVFLSEELQIRDIQVRGNRAKLKLGSREAVCWEPLIFENLKLGDRVRVAYSIVDGDINLIDVEDKNGAG